LDLRQGFGMLGVILPEAPVWDRRRRLPRMKLVGALANKASAGGRNFEVMASNPSQLRQPYAVLRPLAQAELARVIRLTTLGELAASLAHEITQPIGSARNKASAALYFLDKQPAELTEVREALGCVVGDAGRAGDIIDRVRERIKKAAPRKERFGVLPVQGDRVQVQHVLLNLVLNAVEAMGSVQGGPRELSISTAESDADGVLVAVRDSGPGIDPGTAERVFDAFYTTKSSGLGMGLSICRSIIDAHGADRMSANKPRGAVFRFTLPRAGRELINPNEFQQPQKDTVSGTFHRRAC
jgi:signal transduction histidine kinase